MVDMFFNANARIYNKINNMNNNELKSYLETDNKSGYKTKEKHIKINFSELHDKIINNNGDDWIEKLYNYANNINENPKCLHCGKELRLKIYSKGYHEYCSKICKNKSSFINDKKKITSLLKYGVDNPSKSEVIKEKIKSKLYVDGKWYNETDEFKKKTKETYINKYGVDSYSKLDEYHEKVKKTNIERYGMDSYNKTDESKNRCKQHNLEKYGTEYYLSTEEFKEKSKISSLKKYGVDSYTKTDEYKEKMKKYYIKKYGVEHCMQVEEFKNKMVDTMIKRYGEIWRNYAPKYNVNSIIYLDVISEKIGIKIQHALNGGEKKFVKYWVDGYIKEYNICIEWDEKHHNGTRQRERDVKKETFIKENFKCIIIKINQNEFLKDIDNNTIKYVNEILKLIAG